ncbi:MAG: energy-coupling factor ABC transporter ATP-binding protein [Lachnospiraceae bacterium]|nr:energy-coupling factor ABC transporter ATP-binding protein [Lachnospiraceae bacterium]
MTAELKKVSFSYEGSSEGALYDVDLKIRDGEFVVLIGKSGCGKTTITRLINGISPYYLKGDLTGEVLLGERPVGERKSYELAGIVGSVFQNPRTQFFNTDTDSELAFGLENMGMDADAIIRRMDEVTSEMDIAYLRDRNIFQLSGGEKQKIAFSGIYAARPEIYVLDEPSSNLDEKGIGLLKRSLEKIKAQGRTVLCAEHRLYYLADLADRFVWLKDGRIKGEFTQEEMLGFSDETLAEMGLRSVRETMTDPEKISYGDDDRKGLRLEHLELFRGKKRLNDEINISIPRGCVTGIVGENGVGKSTLLRTLAGLHSQYKGEIYLEGAKQNSGQLLKNSFMVMQDVNYQLFAESVYRECTLGQKGISKKQIEEVLTRLDLYGLKDRHPNTISGGQKQRLSIAVGLISNRDVILFDEPTSGLDAGNMRRVADIVMDLKRQDKYVIIVSHDQEFMNLCCDRIIAIHQSN